MKIYLAVCDACGINGAHVFTTRARAENQIDGEYPCEHTPLAYGTRDKRVKAHKMRVVVATIAKGDRYG